MMLLDDLSGFEFETKMETVFGRYGYENVEQTPLTGDKGRDILMRETANGQERAVVVECKHKDQVSREDVQKLHSAILSYEYSGPTRGMIVTSGRFSAPAREHVEHLRRNVDGTEIELVDGAQLSEIAAEIGMDIQNGKFEMTCKHTLPPAAPTETIETPLNEQADTIANIEPDDLSKSKTTIRFQPVVSIQAHTDAVCETSNRVLRRFSERDEFLLDGTQTPPDRVEDSRRDLLTPETPQTVPLIEWQDTDEVSDTTVEQFSQSETDYEEWAVDHLQSKYAKTIPYTGDNNVDYEKDCVPDDSEISITSLTPMRVPRVRSQISLKEYDYALEYDAVGAKRDMLKNELDHCVHCGWSWLQLTYCGNCGAIACRRHTKTERHTGESICAGCAVTARFGLRKRYFADEANRDAFRETYDEMDRGEKILENWPWIASVILITTGFFVILLI